MLKIDAKYGNKSAKLHNIPVPYHLYNELTFHPPRSFIDFNKSTDWHFCCLPLLNNKQYLEEILPRGKDIDGKYRIRIEL